MFGGGVTLDLKNTVGAASLELSKCSGSTMSLAWQCFEPALCLAKSMGVGGVVRYEFGTKCGIRP